MHDTSNAQCSHKSWGDNASTHLGQRWIPSRQQLVGVLRGRFRDQAFTPLAGSNAETLYGRLGRLHLDRADRLDSI